MLREIDHRGEGGTWWVPDEFAWTISVPSPPAPHRNCPKPHDHGRAPGSWSGHPLSRVRGHHEPGPALEAHDMMLPTSSCCCRGVGCPGAMLMSGCAATTRLRDLLGSWQPGRPSPGAGRQDPGRRLPGSWRRSLEISRGATPGVVDGHVAPMILGGLTEWQKWCIL